MESKNLKNGFFKKALNPKKGPFRLTLVLSIIIGVFLGNKAAQIEYPNFIGFSGWFDFLVWFLGGRGGTTLGSFNFQLGKFIAVFIGTSAIIWSIYFIIYWIAIGFTNKE